MSFPASLSPRLLRLDARLDRWPRAAFIAFAAAAALVLSLVAFSPRWWLLAEPAPGSFQWSRGLGYLAQCADPFRPDVEPALRWRLLPPLVAHALGLRGLQPLLLPWLGVVALLLACAHWSLDHLRSRAASLGFCVIVATTSAVLVPLGWLGLNDAWIWLGLLAVVFARSAWCLPLACLLCPWIDERFLIGLPLAWWARLQLQPDRAGPRPALLAALACAPYVVARVSALAHAGHGRTDSGFFAHTLDTCLVWLPIAPLGWWFGLRAAAALAAFGVAAAPDLRSRASGLFVATTTLLASSVLAADLSRSVAILLPLVAVGAIRLGQAHPAHAPALLCSVACANLLLPAAHVVHAKIDVISPLPLELYRLLR